MHADSGVGPVFSISNWYSTNGGSTYAQCSTAVGSPMMNPEFAYPTGSSSYLWDSVADGVGLAGSQPVWIRLDLFNPGSGFAKRSISELEAELAGESR